jgi:hypothetical protein
MHTDLPNRIATYHNNRYAQNSNSSKAQYLRENLNSAKVVTIKKCLELIIFLSRHSSSKL